jgi:hypothetical protein
MTHYSIRKYGTGFVIYKYNGKIHERNIDIVFKCLIPPIPSINGYHVKKSTKNYAQQVCKALNYYERHVGSKCNNVIVKKKG